MAAAACAQQVTEVPALLKRAVGAPAHRPFDCTVAKRGVGRRASGLSEFGRTRVGLPAALDPTNPNAYHYLALALNNIKRWDEALQARNAPQRCARPSAPTALASYSACRLQRKPQRSAPRPHNSNTEPNVHRRAHAAQRCSTDGAVRCGAVRRRPSHAAIARNGRRRNRRDTVGSRSSRALLCLGPVPTRTGWEGCAFQHAAAIGFKSASAEILMAKCFFCCVAGTSLDPRSASGSHAASC